LNARHYDCKSGHQEPAVFTAGCRIRLVGECVEALPLTFDRHLHHKSATEWFTALFF
jgi:hypothetical protein